MNQTDFTANWFAVPGNTGQQIQYRKTGTTAWTLANVPPANSTYTTPATLLANTAYDYRLRIKCGTIWLAYTTVQLITTAPFTGGSDDRAAVAQIATEQGSARLHTNAPNPFSDETNIRFYLPERVEATLSVLDLTGKIVFRKKDFFEKGENVLTLNASELGASTVLVCRLETAEGTVVRKMLRVE